MENIIGLLPEEYIIVDPFAGTGTTGVACENLNRDYILIEKDIEYCRIAREKIKQTKNKLPLNKII